MLKAFNVQFLHVITNFPPTPHNFRVYAIFNALRLESSINKCWVEGSLVRGSVFGGQSKVTVLNRSLVGSGFGFWLYGRFEVRNSKV